MTLKPAITPSHIVLDENGIARIAGTRMKVIHLVMDKMATHSTPEQMKEQFPSLSLAQIHAAFAYYYDHKAELDAQIDESRRTAAAMQVQVGDSPSRDDLRRRLK